MKAKDLFLWKQLCVVKYLLPFCLFTFLSLSANGQQRHSCTPNVTRGAQTRAYLNNPNIDWDPNCIYRQPVVLVTFADRDFKMDDPADYYHRLFNEPGYNEGKGKGCVADYFREQSGGLFNLQFDIYGPVKVNDKARIDKRDSENRGFGSIMKAMEELRATVDANFSVYDWDGDGTVEQVLFIMAGFTGNQVAGCVWPNTGFADLKAPGGIYAEQYSISCELWGDGASCGIGTIIHEFCHCLGLPDLYPTTDKSDFSVVDEWDLMDGGNYTNRGWCPPNFSALEKMLMGWKYPIELTDDTRVTGMKSVSEGGETYIICNSGNEEEFYLLENRQQDGWDYASPGHGLLIFHVDYNQIAWTYNTVNIYPNHRCYDLFHADRRDYISWDPSCTGSDMSKYTMPDRMRNKYLSTSAYPYVEGSLTANSLTDSSDPAATLFNPNEDGGNFMSKPITNIQEADDGTISFDFKVTPTAFASPFAVDGAEPIAYYDLNGRRLPSVPFQSGIYIARYSDGTTRKVGIVGANKHK